MSQPLILITNDDGVNAPGIAALSAALAELGEVYVVAPDREVSACGHSLTLKNPLRAEQVRERTYAVDGTPADCVTLALLKLLPRSPSLVASGINRGANLGDDVYYSGTVGGAREGTFYGIPSLAFSLAAKSETDYSHAAACAQWLGAQALERGLPKGTLLNVNVPAGEPEGSAFTVQGRRQREGTVIEGLDPRRRTYYWIEEGRDRWLSDDISDIHAVRNGLISITPLQTDTTHHDALAFLRQWPSAPGSNGSGSGSGRVTGD